MRESGSIFLERVVVFPLVLAGAEREALLAVADRLSTELGYRQDREILGLDSRVGADNGGVAGILNSEDELLVAKIRLALAKVAAAVDGDRDGEASGRAVGAALDGVEMVMRGELLMGNAGQLPTLMPSFVFLVVLPAVEQDRALEIAKRAARLLEGVSGVE